MSRIVAASLTFILLLSVARNAFLEEDHSTPPKKTVHAVVYQIWVVEGAMDMIHGGGEWIREIHLPEANISFNVWNGALYCLATYADRYPMALPPADPTQPGSAPLAQLHGITDHPARKLADIEIDEEFVRTLQQILALREKARQQAEGYFAAAPPLAK